ncbi:MAG: hypothetical protein ACRENI_15180, partial [Gemmatimonadaceae bacterium]
MNLARSFTVATLVVAPSIVGCTDTAVGPRTSPMPVGALTPDIIVDRIAPDSLSADFTVTPTGGSFVLGKHAIYFPPHSICDPGSSYGLSQWDAPCVVAD